MKKNKLKISKPHIFLLIVVLIYVIIYLINPGYAKNSFSNFINTVLKIFPVLVFVFAIMFFVNYFFRPEKIKKHIGHESGIKGWIYTLFVGMFVPMGPPYVVFPLLRDLKKQGMREALIVAFLYSRNLQVFFLIVMVHYFGMLFTMIVAFYVFIFSILSGILIEKICSKKLHCKKCICL